MIKKFVFTFALVFLSFSPALAARDINQLYLEGISDYQAGNYEQAEKDFMAVLNLNSRHLPSLYMMGDTLAKDVRRLREAEKWYRKALRDGDKDRLYGAKSRFSLGILLIRLGQYEDAANQLHDLAANFPEFYDMAKAYNHLGVADYKLDRYDEALDDFKRALKLDGNLMEAVFNLKSLQNKLALLNIARYYERMGDFNAAGAQYEKAIEAYPNYVGAWYHQGLLQIKKKDYDGALKSLIRAKALNPKYQGGDEIPYQMAGVYTARKGPGDLEEALKVYLRSPNFKDSILKLGSLYVDMGQLDPAEETFTTATAADQDKRTQAEAWYQLGKISQIKNDSEKAEERFKKARELNPNEERYKGAIEVPASGAVSSGANAPAK